MGWHYYYRNVDKPLPVKMNGTNNETVALPLFIYENSLPEPCVVALDLIFWQADSHDIDQVKVNGKEIVLTFADPEWLDGQLYCDQPQPTAGGWRSFPITSNKFLKMTYRVPKEEIKYGENTICIVFRDGVCRSGITVEKAELNVAWTR